jgi:F0F1-type ATP synthase assembly protein I
LYAKLFAGVPADQPSPEGDSPPEQAPLTRASRQFAMAMELPFVLVGSIFTGALFGFFLDRWLGTKPLFTLLLGGLGFAAGVREVLRRMTATSDGGISNKKL